MAFARLFWLPLCMLAAASPTHALTNVALGKTATQISTIDPTTAASNAIDGDINTISHTEYESQPWIEVDLQASYLLDSVNIINRVDCCQYRLTDFYILVSNAPFTSTDLATTLSQPGVTVIYQPGSGDDQFSAMVATTGRYIRVQLNGSDYLNLSEIQAFAAAVPLFNGGFESPSTTSYVGSPAASAWRWTGSAGITRNNSDYTFGNPDTPEGRQVAFLQYDGTMSQDITLAAGVYSVAFVAAQRIAYSSGAQILQVSIDGVAIGNFTPPDGNYSPAEIYFSVAAGSHTLTFTGLGSGNEKTAFVDAVSVSPGSAVLANFNAFESATGASSTAGVIHTKVAGSAFTVDVVALNSSGTSVLITFTGDVKIELLDASDNSGSMTGSCRSSWTALTGSAPTTVTLGSGDAGRKTVTISELDAWPDVRVRVSYPATGTPTTVGCSVDDFAIRPSSFAGLRASDGTSATAGTSRTIATLSATGGQVHKAGQPFTIQAVAVNGISATTTRYGGTPTLVMSTCGGAACLAGWSTVSGEGGNFSMPVSGIVRYGYAPTWLYLTLGPGSVGCNSGTFGGDPTPGFYKSCEVSRQGTLVSTPTASAGVINRSATYDEVGSFSLQLIDTTFAAVDASDGSTDAERKITSSVIDVGRFVPDHFDVTSLAAPVLRTFGSSSCVAARSFTYVGQPFGFATVAQATVTAKNAAGNTTVNYAGSLWKLAASSLAQSYASTPVSPALDASAVNAATLTSNGDGTGLFVSAAADMLRFIRPSATPVAPFNANIALNWSVTDASETGVSGNGSISTTTPLVFSNIPFDAGNQMRFGVLRLTPAYGSELIDLPVRVEAQYWDGQRMATNAADSCTALPAATLAMSNYQRSLAACKTAVSAPLTLLGGRTFAKLAKPGNGNNGSVDLALQLGASASGQTCTAVGGSTTAAATANLPWLQGKWSGAGAFDQNPATRASFGQYRSPMIYQREMF